MGLVRFKLWLRPRPRSALVKKAKQCNQHRTVKSCAGHSGGRGCFLNFLQEAAGMIFLFPQILGSSGGRVSVWDSVGSSCREHFDSLPFSSLRHRQFTSWTTLGCRFLLFVDCGSPQPGIWASSSLMQDCFLIGPNRKNLLVDLRHEVSTFPEDL